MSWMKDLMLGALLVLGSAAPLLAQEVSSGSVSRQDHIDFLRWAARQYDADEDLLLKLATLNRSKVIQFSGPTFMRFAHKAKAANPQAWSGLGDLSRDDWRQRALAAAWALESGKAYHWGRRYHQALRRLGRPSPGEDAPDEEDPSSVSIPPEDDAEEPGDGPEDEPESTGDGRSLLDNRREWARNQGRRPLQFQGWEARDRLAACGLIAIEAVERFLTGRPELDVIDEIRDTAVRQRIWAPPHGMSMSAVRRILRQRGIETDWVPLKRGPGDDMRELENALVAALRANKPPILLASHYYVVQGYADGRFFVGYTGRIMSKHGGKKWMTLEEIARAGVHLNGRKIQGLVLPEQPASLSDVLLAAAPEAAR